MSNFRMRYADDHERSPEGAAELASDLIRFLHHETLPGDKGQRQRVRRIGEPLLSEIDRICDAHDVSRTEALKGAVTSAAAIIYRDHGVVPTMPWPLRSERIKRIVHQWVAESFSKCLASDRDYRTLPKSEQDPERRSDLYYFMKGLVAHPWLLPPEWREWAPRWVNEMNEYPESGYFLPRRATP